MRVLLILIGCLVCILANPAGAVTADGKKKVVIIAGKPSHWPRTHEFRAGVLLFQKCLAGVPGLSVEIGTNGWVQDEKSLDDADAVVFYADGAESNPAIQDNHLATLTALMKKGVGFGCVHAAVEAPADNGGAQFKQWLGGHYEKLFSCNPTWDADFTQLPDHPIARGVKPFQLKDEWYFNMRFAGDFTAEKPATAAGMSFVPILSAAPSDAVRKGPYSYPKGPYDHIVAASGRREVLMWAVERPDGGRGFGFTGGHYQDNWGDDNFRKIVLNAIVWVARLDVPANGVESQISKDELNQNLDHKVIKDNKVVILP
ncbi:MAG TPA: ThuA domain-containing protein [Verrucomicrobiae bacterium]